MISLCRAGRVGAVCSAAARRRWLSSAPGLVEETCIRLSQYVRLSGICSRNEAERLIKSGRVKINDQVATYGGTALTQAELVTVTIDDISIKVPGNKIQRALELGNEAVKRTKPGEPTASTSHADLYSVPPRVWLYNKPRGEVCSFEPDTKGRPTIGQTILMRLFGEQSAAAYSRGRGGERNSPNDPVGDGAVGLAGSRPVATSSSFPSSFSSSRPALKPVERMDFGTEGVCVVTDSGDFARWLCSDAAGILRTYRVRVNGLVTQEKLDGLRRGIVFAPASSSSSSSSSSDAKKSLPLVATVDASRATGSNCWLTLTTPHSNKARNIQTAFAKLYLRPVRIICTAFGPFRLPAPGARADERDRLRDVGDGAPLAVGDVAEVKVPVALMARYLEGRGQR